MVVAERRRCRPLDPRGDDAANITAHLFGRRRDAGNGCRPDREQRGIADGENLRMIPER